MKYSHSPPIPCSSSIFQIHKSEHTSHTSTTSVWITPQQLSCLQYSRYDCIAISGADWIPSLTFHFQTQSGSVDGSHLACSVGQTPAKSSPASPDGEDVGEWQLPEEKAAERVASVYWAWDKLWKFYRETLTQSEQWVSFLSSGKVCSVCVCVHDGGTLTHKVSSTVSHTRLTRLSASGSPYYINGKCSVEDNTHMVGCDERWHPARD